MNPYKEILGYAYDERTPIGEVTSITKNDTGTYVTVKTDTGIYGTINNIVSRTFRDPIPAIKRVIFNPPATIVMWSDDTKTVVKADKEKYDPEKGLAMAISKKALGNKGNYFEEFKKWVGDNPKVELTDSNTNTSKIIIDAFRKNLKNTFARYGARRAFLCLNAALLNKKATKADLIAAIREAEAMLGHQMAEDCADE